QEFPRRTDNANHDNAFGLDNVDDAVLTEDEVSEIRPYLGTFRDEFVSLGEYSQGANLLQDALRPPIGRLWFVAGNAIMNHANVRFRAGNDFDSIPFWHDLAHLIIRRKTPR